MNPFAAAASGTATAPAPTPGLPALGGAPAGLFGAAGSALAPAGATPGLPATASAAPQGISDEVDFDSNIEIRGLERMPKLAKDQVARVALVLFNQKQGGTYSPRIRMSESFSFGAFGDPNAVNFIAPKHNKDLMVYLTKKGGKEPTTKFGAILLHYDTNAQGTLLPDGGFKLEGFTFGPDKWNSMRSKHAEWGLHEHDMTFLCTEPNYQKLDIGVAREAYWRNLPAEMMTDMLARAETLFEGPLQRFMGFRRSDEDIVKWLQTGTMPKNSGTAGSSPPIQHALPANAHNPFGVGGALPTQTQQPALPPVSPSSVAQQAGVGDGAAASFSDLVVQSTNMDAAAPAATPAAPPTDQSVTGLPAPGANPFGAPGAALPTI